MLGALNGLSRSAELANKASSPLALFVLWIAILMICLSIGYAAAWRANRVTDDEEARRGIRRAIFLSLLFPSVAGVLLWKFG